MHRIQKIFPMFMTEFYSTIQMSEIMSVSRQRIKLVTIREVSV